MLAGLIRSEGCEEELVPWLSPSCPWPADYLWYSLDCRSITLISAFHFHLMFSCMCVWVQIFIVLRTPVIGLGSHSTPVSLHLNKNNYICSDLFPNSHILRYWGLGLKHMDLGGYITTHNNQNVWPLCCTPEIDIK